MIVLIQQWVGGGSSSWMLLAECKASIHSVLGLHHKEIGNSTCWLARVYRMKGFALKVLRCLPAALCMRYTMIWITLVYQLHWLATAWAPLLIFRSTEPINRIIHHDPMCNDKYLILSPLTWINLHHPDHIVPVTDSRLHSTTISSGILPMLNKRDDFSRQVQGYGVMESTGEGGCCVKQQHEQNYAWIKLDSTCWQGIEMEKITNEEPETVPSFPTFSPFSPSPLLRIPTPTAQGRYL